MGFGSYRVLLSRSYSASGPKLLVADRLQSAKTRHSSMTPNQFVENWIDLKAELMAAFMGDRGNAEIATMIHALALSAEQREQLRGVLDTVLRDTMYTLLLGLDGAASIGSDQQTYTIRDEAGNIVTAGGALEEPAWKAFHGSQQQPSGG